MKNLFEGWGDIDFADLETWPATFKIFGALLVAIGIIYAAYHFKVIDQRKQLATAVLKEEQLKNEFKEKKALAINLDAYKAQMIEAENMFSVLKEQLPSQTEIPDLLVDVTQLGLSRGLVFEQFEPRVEVTKGFYKEKPVKIIVSGSYHELANFVSDVAALPRIVNVNDFEILRKDSKVDDFTKVEGEKSPLKMNALIKTYYYEEGQ